MGVGQYNYITICLKFVGRYGWEWVARIILCLMFAGRN